MDILITSLLPQTKIKLNKIELLDEFGNQILPSKDCYDYYDYGKMEDHNIFSPLIQSFYVEGLPAGVYFFPQQE